MTLLWRTICSSMTCSSAFLENIRPHFGHCSASDLSLWSFCAARFSDFRILAICLFFNFLTWNVDFWDEDGDGMSMAELHEGLGRSSLVCVVVSCWWHKVHSITLLCRYQSNVRCLDDEKTQRLYNETVEA